MNTKSTNKGMQHVTRAFAVMACALLFAACNKTERADRTDTTTTPATATTDTNTSALGTGASVREPAGTDASTTDTSATTIDTTSATTSDADNTLTERVRTTLQSDTAIAGKVQNLQVSASNGKVTLRGTVNSDQEKRDLEKKVQQLIGTAKVDNQLEVKSTNQ
jgi:hyperosmotically inducible periplasmic protein